LALPEPPLARSSDTVYGMSVLDRGGRIADRSTVAALGWTPGTRLRVHIARTNLTLRAALNGRVAVKDRGFLWLPAAARHRLDLRPGDRVLLAAEPKRQTLVIYPPATLDELLAHGRSASKAGDRDE
jgi:bifunctional DNA-binding transcriptional regulator/antitoxin component of YhaV-PrlF toxin-antitoxin module